MALTQLGTPYPVFTDTDGTPLDAGFLYFGAENQNPETNPITVYYDAALTQPAAQPLRTSNGYVMRNGSPAILYAGVGFSVTVRNAQGELVIYAPTSFGISVPSTYGGPTAENVAALLADVTFTYTAAQVGTVSAGDIIRTRKEGFAYEVAASSATDQHVTTAGGVKLYVQLNDNGKLPVAAFGVDTAGTLGSESANVTKIQTAVDTGFDLVWPTGQIRIDATIDASDAGAWWGAGWGDTPYNSDYDNKGTFIQLIGANSGNAFILPPEMFCDFHIDGVDKSGVAVQVGQNGSFTGVRTWKNIRIRRASLGLDLYNIFLFRADDVSIMDCTNGVQHTPTDGPGDDGYSTTVRWTGWHIADCDSWGVDLSPALTSGTWTWRQVVIERNAESAGSWQARLQRMRIAGYGIYLEGTNTKPCLSMSATNLFGDEWFVNNTGGWDFNSSGGGVDLSGVRFATSTDVIANTAATVRLFFRRSTIQTDITALPATKKLDWCNVAGVDYDETRIASLSVGVDSTEQPQPTALIEHFTTTYSGTVPANSRATVFSDQFFQSISADAVAIGFIEDYQRDLIVNVTVATSGSTNFLTVVIHNLSGAGITLTDAKINITVIRAAAQIAV